MAKPLECSVSGGNRAKNGRSSRVLAAVLLSLTFDGLFANVAMACKDRILPGFFLWTNWQRTRTYTWSTYRKWYRAVLSQKSWYAPPFTFEARILKSLKGPKKAGAVITGRTGSGEGPAARCSIFLTAGGDYLLVLNRQDSPFILPRYGSPYVPAQDKNFTRYVDQIADFYAGHY